MIKEIVSVLVLAVAIAGCSSKTDQAIVEAEMGALEEIAITEESRVDNLKAAHSETVAAIVSVPDATAGERILGMALVSRDFTEAAKSRMSDILDAFKRATLGTDVQEKGVEIVPVVAPYAMGGAIGITAVRADRGSVSNKTTNGDVNNSLEENHATGLGDDSSPHNDASEQTITNEVEPEVSE